MVARVSNPSDIQNLQMEVLALFKAIQIMHSFGIDPSKVISSNHRKVGNNNKTQINIDGSKDFVNP